MQRYIHKAIGIGVIAAVNAYPLTLAGHAVWAVAFGLLAPALGIYE